MVAELRLSWPGKVTTSVVSHRNVDAGARFVDISARLVTVDAAAGWQLDAVQILTASEAPQYDLSNAIGTRRNNDVVWTYQHVEFSAAVQVIGRQRTYLGIDGGIHHFAGQKISLADESGDKTVSRVMEELLRRGYLLDLTLADDSHLIRQGEGLFLVVGDENRSFVGLAKDRLDLFTNRHSHRRVEVAEWLIQENDRRLGSKCACQRNSLLLTAG